MACPRRSFLGDLALPLAAALAGCATLDPGRTARSGTGEAKDNSKKEEEVEISPGEDLMQEHGVLQRLFLIYDDAAARVSEGKRIDGDALASAVKLMRRFAEDYHEKSEEDLVFPRLEKVGREQETVSILKKQHARGRELTDEILRLSQAPSDALAKPLRAYVRMMRPHIARENTTIFPTFREIIGQKGYLELGDAFEERERQRVGDHGFEHAVIEVAKLEAAFGLDDLSRFTA